MKYISTALVVLLTSLAIRAQDTKAEFLKEPSAWEFERFTLPPSFSPDFPYKGVEELRFSPGMFKKDATDYFSYAFVAQLDNTSSLTETEIKNYLLTYFKGLCASTAKQRNLSIDTSEVSVSMEMKKGIPDNSVIYNAVLEVFGVFADGAPVALNAEVKVLNDLKAKKTYLVFIGSPTEKSHNIWKQLLAIQNGFTIHN